MDFQFSNRLAGFKGVLVIPVVTGKQPLTAFGTALDRTFKGALSHALAYHPKFTGARNQTLLINGIVDPNISQILLIGAGEAQSLEEQDIHALGGTIAVQLIEHGFTKAAIYAADLEGMTGYNGLASQLAFGVKLRAYRFDIYKTAPKQKPVTEILLITSQSGVAQTEWKTLSGLAEGIYLARDLVTEPANILYPKTFIERVQKAIKGTGLTVRVLDEKQMKKLGMGALLAVNQGSEHDPYTLIIEYNGLKSGQKNFPLALVGKGVTFDTGGYSLKVGPGVPGYSIADMKTDMAGGAAIVGAMLSLARRKAKANVVGLIGLVENRIDDEAFLPGDVLTSMSGKTIEVLNTDAEGRLVLADVMWYAQETYKPDIVVDIATLSGSTLIALGEQYAGLYSEDDDLVVQIIDAGCESGEDTWHMPISASPINSVNSKIADIANMGISLAKSSDAAMFLQNFVQEDVQWAHIDMVGMAWSRAGNVLTPPGATGYGVRLLDRLVQNMMEK